MFKHYPLKLVLPSFDSPLTALTFELERLRYSTLEGTTPTFLFEQLKRTFHFLESIGSARIEGNHTTIAEYIETKIESEAEALVESIREINNIEEAMLYIEESIAAGYPVNESLLKQIHHLVVQGLSREGDPNAGAYRTHNVSIANAKHTPPDFTLVPQYMEELFAFLGEDHPPYVALIKLALVHHRFAWIHPFGNGNGRTVRLLTYALLLQYGYGLQASGRILNPTAVFCSDRERYYDMLAVADQGDEQPLLKWCEYVVSGLKEEIEKLDRLSNYIYVQDHILLPALKRSLDRKIITEEEYRILVLASRRPEIQNSDIVHLYAGNTTKASRKLADLVKFKMLAPVAPNKRKYSIQFSNSYLFRNIMWALGEEDFLPEQEEL